MKTRLFVALLLTAVLALPALAQQTGATTQDQPAAATTGAGASGKPALQPDTHEGFWGKINPFARKKYVQRQTAPIRDRVNELDELTSSNTKMIKDTDSRAQEGIRLASTKATEADQHAIDAGNKATMAQQTATAANTRLTTVEQVVGNIDQYKASTQTEIRFRPGQSVLSTNAKTALDDMATPLKIAARLHHRSAGLLLRSRPGRDRHFAEDGGRGGSLPRAQSRNSGLPDLRGRHGQRSRTHGSRRRRQDQAHQRWTRRDQPPEERSGNAGLHQCCPGSREPGPACTAEITDLGTTDRKARSPPPKASRASRRLFYCASVAPASRRLISDC